MKVNLLNIFLLLYCCTLAPSCNHSHQNKSLQEGDLLFQDFNCGDLCNTIEAVTEGFNGKGFSHCAIVVKITKAIAFVKQQIGQPYDNDFLIDNGKWYCSELLYQSFKEANNQKDLFGLEPMTFKDPKTNNYFPIWVDYYKQLNIEIPEGKQGVNPGLISRSSKIQILKFEHII